MPDKLTFLIAEDGIKVREGIRKLLEKNNYPLRILEAADGEQARKILEREQVDILMTDVEMPIIDGLRLGEIARAMHPDIKIIVFSAHSKFEYARSAISLEAVHYLLKPIDVMEFQEVMDRVITMCRQSKHQLSSRPAQDEYDLLFRDIFCGLDFSHDNLSQIPFFVDNRADIHCILYYVSLKTDFFFSHNQELSEFVRRAKGVETHLFIIDNRQILVAFKHHYYQPWDMDAWHKSFMEWLARKDPSCIALAVCGEGGHGIHHTYGQLNQILALKELQFYIRETTQISTNSRVGVTGSRKAIDIKPLLDTINQDIRSRNYLSVQSNISILLQMLTVNHEFSSLYVKYLFMNIVNAIYESASNRLPSKAETIMAALSHAESIDQIETCILPLLDKLANQETNNNLSRSVSLLVQHIHKEYASDLTLEYLAEKVCLTPSYISSLFKKETGKSITTYINEYRMEKAKAMLRNTNMKLVDIAAAVGYSSQIYFNMLFKKMFGLTPSQYRESGKNIPTDKSGTAE